MRLKTTLLLLIIGLVSVAAGCTDYIQAEDAEIRLEDAGYQLGAIVPETDTFLNHLATVIPVIHNGQADGQVQFYVFQDIDQAKTVASGISEDGSSYTWSTGPGTSSSSGVEWTNASFFQSGDAIAIYVGDDHCVRSVLAGLMGNPFAGPKELGECGAIIRPAVPVQEAVPVP